MEKEEVFDKVKKTHRYTDIDFVEIELKDEDILRIADESSKLNEKKIKLEGDFKVWAKRKKDEIASVTSDLDRNFDKIKTRQETIEDNIEILKDYDAGIITRFHKDEIIDEKNMSDFELRNVPTQLKEAESVFENNPIVEGLSTPTKDNAKVHPDQDKIALDQVQSSREAQDHPVSVNAQ